jgi:hypothetical protein
MTIMRMVKVSVHHVIHVIAMGNRLVAALCTVPVFGAVCTAVMTVGAVGRIPGADIQFVLVHMSLVKRVQMAVVNVIGVPVVQDRNMTAVLAMLMRVVLVSFVLI